MNAISLLLIFFGILNFFDYLTTKIALMSNNIYEGNVIVSNLIEMKVYDIAKIGLSVLAFFTAKICYHSKIRSDKILLVLLLGICITYVIIIINNINVILSYS